MTRERYTTWATNERDEKILIALQLDTANFKIILYTFEESAITKDFANKMLNEWTKGEVVEFPEGTVGKDLELSDDALLPENIKVEGKTGAIRQLQNEWSYVLLTTKLWESFNIELDEIKQKARELKEYSHELFDQCKTYWERALEYRKENDLSQERINQIKEEINNVFDHLKFLRQNAAKERDEVTEKFKAEINEALAAVAKTLESSNIHFKNVMEELKGIQAKLKDANVRRDVKNALFDEVQKYFEILKSKRSDTHGAVKNKRLEGLKAVIEKIEKSLNNDKRDLEYNLKRMDNSNVSKLEMQLREAKLKMIRDWISSKEEKLKDIQITYAKIEKDYADKSENKKKQNPPKSSQTADGGKGESNVDEGLKDLEEIDESVASAEELKVMADAEKLLSEGNNINQ
ncbi:MAG: hypothetical protein KA797_02630 [Chitinophagales bacterium]|nr:hypothetical protein [Chitinophagales bacterium]